MVGNHKLFRVGGGRGGGAVWLMNGFLTERGDRHSLLIFILLPPASFILIPMKPRLVKWFLTLQTLLVIHRSQEKQTLLMDSSVLRKINNNKGQNNPKEGEIFRATLGEGLLRVFGKGLSGWQTKAEPMKCGGSKRKEIKRRISLNILRENERMPSFEIIYLKMIVFD